MFTLKKAPTGIILTRAFILVYHSCLFCKFFFSDILLGNKMFVLDIVYKKSGTKRDNSYIKALIAK